MMSEARDREGHTHTHTHMYMKRTRAAGAYQYQTEGHRRWSLFVIHTTLQKINSFRHAFMNSWRSHGDDDELKGRSSLTEARRRKLVRTKRSGFAAHYSHYLDLIHQFQDLYRGKLIGLYQF